MCRRNVIHRCGESKRECERAAACVRRGRFTGGASVRGNAGAGEAEADLFRGGVSVESRSAELAVAERWPRVVILRAEHDRLVRGGPLPQLIDRACPVLGESRDGVVRPGRWTEQARGESV